MRMVKMADDRSEPASGKGQFSLFLLIAADINASAAQDAAIGVVIQERVAPIDSGCF
jgi:hypothetical protein